jgi:hypothetical protein
MPRLTPEQMALLRQLTSGMASNPDLANTISGRQQEYTGRFAPETSRLENLSLAALEQQAMNAVGGGTEDPMMTEARGQVGRAMSPDVDMEGFNTMFRGGVQDPMLRAFREEVLPDITSRFSGTTAYGSDRRVAEERAVGRLGDSLSSSRADMLFKTSEGAKDRSLRAAELTPRFTTDVTNSRTSQLMSMLAAGGVPRQAEDTRLTREYAEFVRRQGERGKSVEMALALLGLSPMENISTVTPGSPGLLTSAAQGAGAAFGRFMLG